MIARLEHLRMPLVSACAFALAIGVAPHAASAQGDTLVSLRNDSVMIRLVDVDLRAAIQALGRYLDKPVAIGAVTGGRLTFETPRPVARSDLPRLVQGLLANQSVQLVADSVAGIYRLEPREAPRPVAQAGAPGGSGSSQGQDAQGIRLFVIHLRHARAPDVAAAVNALYGRASALGELPSQRPTLSRGLESQQAPAAPPSQPVASPAMPAQGVVGAATRAATLTGEVTIIPDPRANSLLIRATQADFALIQAAVQEIDIRPLQVMIEVLIAEVRKDRGLDFGVDAIVPESKLRGTENTVMQGSTTGIGLGDFVLKIMKIGAGGIDATAATLRAATSRGDATIVSRPVVLAANNEEAEINVGSQRPFVQVARVLPTDNTARDQVVTYKDVGTRLRVVPTISADGYVMLLVSQEINAATAEQQFNAPVISTRSVQTKLLIKDGQTIVLGGLTDKQHEVTQGGVPFLSSIPWLGGLFGHASRRTTATELFIFLTPRIVRDDDDVEALSKPLGLKAEKIKK
jgi:general secretion pathway protein D